MSQLFAWGGQNIGVSASTSVFPMNTQDWSPLGWTGWIFLQSKGPSRVFSNTTVQKHQHHFMANRWGNNENSERLFWGGSKITTDGAYSHEIKRHLLLGRNVLTNFDSIFKSRDITLPEKVCLVKAMVFPAVMYGCEIRTIKNSEHQRIDVFELWCWRRLFRVPWTARRSNKSILKETCPE